MDSEDTSLLRPGPLPKVGESHQDQSSRTTIGARKPPQLVCKNCDLAYKGYYCPRCGQSSRIDRLTIRTFFTELIFSSLDLENGLWHTIKELVKRPGDAIRSYVEGKRVTLYVPTRFLILVGALSTFISLRYDIFLLDQAETLRSDEIQSFLGSSLSNWYLIHFSGFWTFANEYTTLINVLSIPVFSLFSFLIFIKRGYNYAENMILNIYIVCMQLLLLIVCMPILEMLPNYKSIIMSLYTFLTVVYNIWCYICFYKMMDLRGGLLSFTANALSYVLQFISAHLLYYLVHSFNITIPK